MQIDEIKEKVEQVSKGYTKKFGIRRNSDWFMLKLQEELGELTQSYLMMTKKAKQKGKTEAEIKADFEKELADVFCHVLLLAKYHKVDLEKVIEEKWLKWSK